MGSFNLFFHSLNPLLLCDLLCLNLFLLELASLVLGVLFRLFLSSNLLLFSLFLCLNFSLLFFLCLLFFQHILFLFVAFALDVSFLLFYSSLLHSIFNMSLLMLFDLFHIVHLHVFLVLGNRDLLLLMLFSD